MKVTKHIVLASLALVLVAAPLRAESVWSLSENQLEQVATQEVRIYVNGSNVRVTGAAKQTMYVYSVTGECVATYRIDGEDKTIALSQPKGVYIIKVGKVARKISLR